MMSWWKRLLARFRKPEPEPECQGDGWHRIWYIDPAEIKCGGGGGGGSYFPPCEECGKPVTSGPRIWGVDGVVQEWHSACLSFSNDRRAATNVLQAYLKEYRSTASLLEFELGLRRKGAALWVKEAPREEDARY